MVQKLFKTVVYVLSIVVLLYFTVDGCQLDSDCPTQASTGSRTQCCDNVFPPRCMTWVLCSLYRSRNRNKQQIPTFRPKPFTWPEPIDVPTFDYNAFTVRHYPNFHHLTFDPPTFNYNPDNYDDDYGDNSSGSVNTGALGGGVAGFLLVLTIILFFVRLARCRSTNHIVQHSSSTITRQTNVVAQHRRELRREPRRIVIIAMPRDEDQITRPQNQAPEGEPPFLSEEDILHNLHHSEEPPRYEEATTGPYLPNYENSLANSTMDQPPPTYPEAQATSQSHIYPSQDTPPIQNVQVPDVPPPAYEEAPTAASNAAVDPLP